MCTEPPWEEQHLDLTFIDAVDKLGQIAKLRAPTKDQCLDASLLVRLLLIDRDRLVGSVSNASRVVPTFIVRRFNEDLGKGPMAAPDEESMGCFQGVAILPSHPDDKQYPSPLLKLTREEFLQNKVGTGNGQTVNVGQLISFACVVMGKAHAKLPRNERERGAFYMHNSLYGTPEMEYLSPIRMIPYIGRITALGLRPMQRDLISALTHSGRTAGSSR